MSRKLRGHPELNQGPLDLQSNALPLSYIPVGKSVRKAEYKSFWFQKRLDASIQSLHLCFCNVIYFFMFQIVKSLHDNNNVTWDGIWYFSFSNFMESLWACFTVMFPIWELFVSLVCQTVWPIHFPYKQFLKSYVFRCRYGGGELCSYLIITLQIGEIAQYKSCGSASNV